MPHHNTSHSLFFCQFPSIPPASQRFPSWRSTAFLIRTFQARTQECNHDLEWDAERKLFGRLHGSLKAPALRGRDAIIGYEAHAGDRPALYAEGGRGPARKTAPWERSTGQDLGASRPTYMHHYSVGAWAMEDDNRAELGRRQSCFARTILFFLIQQPACWYQCSSTLSASMRINSTAASTVNISRVATLSSIL